MANSRLNGPPTNTQFKLQHVKRAARFKNKFLNKCSPGPKIKGRRKIKGIAPNIPFKPKKLVKNIELVPNAHLCEPSKKSKFLSMNMDETFSKELKVENIYNDKIKKEFDDKVIKNYQSLPITLANIDPYNNLNQPNDSNVYVSLPYKHFQNIENVFYDMDVNEARYQNSVNIPDPGWSIVNDFIDDSCTSTSKKEKYRKTKDLKNISQRRLNDLNHRSGLKHSSGNGKHVAEKGGLYMEESVSDEIYFRHHEKYEAIEREYKKRDREWRKLMEDSSTPTNPSFKKRPPVNLLPRGAIAPAGHREPMTGAMVKRQTEIIKEGLRTRHSTTGSGETGRAEKLSLKPTTTTTIKTANQKAEAEYSKDKPDAKEDPRLLLDDNFTTKCPRASFWPSIYDVDYVQIIDDSSLDTLTYPLTAFGRQVPKIEEAPFTLPWSS